MTHDPLREQIAQQFRFAMQLGACDPSDCPLCDCSMDDEGRAQIASLANQQADLVIARVREDERENDGGRIMSAYTAYTLGERDGYAGALRDAVEVVKALGNGKTVPPSDGYADAVAAIEALGGER